MEKKPPAAKSDAFGSSLEITTATDRFRITLEPAGFFYVIANVIQAIVTPNLFLHKVCSVNLRVNGSLCDPRNQTMLVRSSNSTMLIDRIQSYVSTLNIYGSLIDNIPTMLLMLFLLPWSDIHGRKILLIAPLIGHMLCTAVDMANYYIPTLSAEYLLISTVPVGLTGGRGMFFMGLNRFMIDITTTKSRTWRLAILNGVIGISVPLGNLISAYIYTSSGYLSIWITSLSLHSCALLYIVFFIKDSRGYSLPSEKSLKISSSQEQMSDWKTKIIKTGTIIFRNLWDNFRITFKQREGFKRAIICMLIISNCMHILSIANGGIAYLYGRKKIGWDAPDWALYVSIVSSVGSLGTLILVPLLSGLLKVPDGALGIIALFGSMGSSITVAFAVSPLMMYLCSIGTVLAGAIGIIYRSKLSKTAEGADLSAIYAVMSALDSLVPLIASPTMNLLYRSTLHYFPGAVFLLRASISAMLALLLVALIFLEWKDANRLTKIEPLDKSGSYTPEESARSGRLSTPCFRKETSANCRYENRV